MDWAEDILQEWQEIVYDIDHFEELEAEFKAILASEQNEVNYDQAMGVV
jgi:hypothetical protein